MKSLKLFTPIIWILVASYVISYLFDLMNSASTIGFGAGFLGIVLIIYLTIKTRLGLTIIYRKTNNQK